MKITAITKYKHGELFLLLKKLGWSQNELARRAKVQPSVIGLIINLKQRPSQKIADKIQTAFAEEGIFFDVLKEWPESFKGTGRGRSLERFETAEICSSKLVSLNHAKQIAAPAQIDHKKIYGQFMDMLDTLNDREKRVIEQRFWGNKTVREVAKSFNVSFNRISQIESKAIRKMQHPARLRLIKDACEEILT